MSYIQSHPLETVLHAMSIRVSKRCVSLIEVCLRPEEVGEAEREFYLIVRANLEELVEGLARKREENRVGAERN
jgi:hypothetical protein